MIEIILQLVCFLKYCFGIWLRWKTMIRRIFRMLNLEIFAWHMQAKNDAFERESCIWMCASCCMGNNTSDRWGYSYIYIYISYIITHLSTIAYWPQAHTSTISLGPPPRPPPPRYPVGDFWYMSSPSAARTVQQWNGMPGMPQCEISCQSQPLVIKWQHIYSSHGNHHFSQVNRVYKRAIAAIATLDYQLGCLEIPRILIVW